MSEVTIRIAFQSHPCTNHTDGDFYLTDEGCGCSSCRCEEGDYCCGAVRQTQYCPECGAETEQPYCYPCNGEQCECGVRICSGDDVLYSGSVYARWVNGALVDYSGNGHPHLAGTYCLGDAAELFENVTTKEQAIEAIITHISNVDFHDGLGSSTDYYGIEAA